jgi:hypothetical protein
MSSRQPGAPHYFATTFVAAALLGALHYFSTTTGLDSVLAAQTLPPGRVQ